MKKIALLSTMLLILSGFAFANTNSEGADEATIKVGMVTDAGTIDDKSFDQGTWEGIVRAEADLGAEIKYLKPTGTTEADYLQEIGNLYDAGYKFIITPGYKFQTAIEKAQVKYPDAKFVLLDAAPTDVLENTVSVFFTEHDAGFLAGVAAAVELQDGALGFIGGMEIPPVQKFNWGFQQGIIYANESLGTNIVLDEDNIIYQGTFSDVAAGQQIAAQMFDKGVKAIFCAAGGVGVGAINEAKSRATNGEMVYIIGVDADQYGDGVYEGEKSVILTSALKRVDNAAYNMIQEELNGTFPGGSIITLDAVSGGVGLPTVNPNLSDSTYDVAMDVLAKITSGEIVVSGEKGDLIK